MDGVIAGDPAWEGTQSAEGFLVLGTAQPADHATSVRTIWDETTLYFGITASMPSGKKPKTDQPLVWKNDNVEIWIALDSGSRNWAQLIVGAGGKVLVQLHTESATGPLESNVESRAVSGPGGWSAEVAVTFKSLGLPSPKNGSECGLGLHRADYSVTGGQLSSWGRLGRFNQTSQFGRMIFSSDWEVSPEMAYWRQERKREALLRRSRVSAAEIFFDGADAVQGYTLWKYDPASIPAERRARHAALSTYGLFGDTTYWSGYKDLADVAPDFYRAAVGINSAMVALSKLEDVILQEERAAFYATGRPSETRNRLSGPMKELDAAYRTYGAAFDAGWDKNALTGLSERLTTLSASLSQIQGEVTGQIDALRRESGAVPSAVSLRFAEGETSRDASGTPNRLHNTLYGAFPYQVPIKLLWDGWDSVNVDFTRAIPESDGKGTYNFPILTKYRDFIQKTSPGKKMAYHMLFGSYYAMPFPAWVEEKSREDSDILLTSADGLQTAKRPPFLPGTPPVHDGMNINNPFVQNYARESLAALAGQFGNDTAYAVAGWEDNNIYHIPGASANGYRTPFYTRTGKKAFRDELAARYPSLSDLNAKWGTHYPSFDAIEPPPDKWLSPAREADGLTYEWERFTRMNHLAYARLIKDAYQSAAPSTPVLIDDSHFLADGNLYRVFAKDIADIYSFHWTPGNEDALWAQIDRLCTRFGKTSGYYENYVPMYTSRAAPDEIQARAAVREFFWCLYARGVRYAAWWIRPHTGTSEYAAAYGGGFLGLDFDQTILRWSMSLLPVMWERGRTVEKAIVQTVPEPAKVAILQPDATVLTLAARTMRVATALPPISAALLLHNEFLAPGGFPVDFLTADMVLDGRASLKEFDTLILPQGFWMDPVFSLRLRQWVENGGHLIAIGPFAIETPWGAPLTKEESAFLTAFDPVEKTGRDLWSVKFPGFGGPPRVITKPLGRGEIHYLNRSLDAFVRNQSARPLLEELLAKRIPRKVVSNNPEIKVATRVAADGTAYLFPVNVSLTNEATATLTLQGNFSDLWDCVILGGFPVPAKADGQTTQCTVRLAPGDWTVIRVPPERGQAKPSAKSEP